MSDAQPDQPSEQSPSLPRRTPQKAWRDTTRAFPTPPGALLGTFGVPLRKAPTEHEQEGR